MVMLYSECSTEEIERLENSGKFISQQKVDGDNFVVRIEKERTCNQAESKHRVTLINRHNNRYTAQFPEIVAGLKVSKEIQSLTLNGEIAYFNPETQIFDFNRFRSRQGSQNKRKIMIGRLQYPCKFYVFDIIEYNGTSMVNNSLYTFERRHRLLKTIIRNSNVIELLPIRYDLAQHFKEECEAEREGVIIKNVNNIYSNTRTNSMLKLKNWKYSEIKFEGFETNSNDTITLTNDIDRVLCPKRKDIELIKALIVQQGYVNCKVRHLQGRSKESQKIREPSYKEMVIVR